MRKVSDLLSKSLVCLLEGENAGIIKNIIFDSKLRRVKYFVIGGESDNDYALPYAGIYKNGADAALVRTRGKLLKISELPSLTFNNPINREVFTTDGVSLGRVKDVNLADFKNEVISLELAEGTLPVSRVFSASDTVVVLEENARPPSVTRVRKRPAPAVAAPHSEQPVAERRGAGTPSDGVAQQKLVGGDYRFLLGRRLDKTLLGRDKTPLIKKNTVITGAVVEKARLHGLLIELTVHSLPLRVLY